MTHSSKGMLLLRKLTEEMPFKSQAQRAWMYANDPKMAAKWEAHTPKDKKLPKEVQRKGNK